VLLVGMIGMPYLLATVIVFFAGNLWGWIANRVFTFRSSARRAPELTRYLLVMGVSLLLNIACMYLLVDRLGFHYLAASILVGGLFLVGNYVVHRHVTFQV
jgi:putative flippase GtrA